MAFGTAIGGWRIVKTMGMGLTHLKPVGGFCAEVAGAVTLFTATVAEDPGVDDAHDHRRDRRRRLGDQGARHPLGARDADRVGVGLHDPGGRRRSAQSRVTLPARHALCGALVDTSAACAATSS